MTIPSWKASSWRDGKLILKDENQRSFQSLNAELMVGINGATLFGLKDFLTLYASGGYTRSWSEGLNYSHMYDEFYYSVMAQVQYKDFSLLGQFRKVQNNFFGETIKKNENQTAFMAMYTRRNLQAGIGIMFPFTNNYKVGKERISEVAPFRSGNIRQGDGTDGRTAHGLYIRVRTQAQGRQQGAEQQ